MRPPSTRHAIISQAQENAWFALLFTHATVTARIDAVLMERHRISFSAFEILCRLQDLEPQPVRALAGQLVSVSPTRASRLVQDLIDDGHLRRGADQDDGRISLIGFTETGRQYAEAVAETFEASVRKYFVDPLDEEDIAAISRIWQKLESAAD
ncbi:MarR family winged helix-turn-helix transcriptional regulator [Streptomyces sp. NBC_01476]|uniref:MarR family winged helix-turn-helix transcriptional regulator n=1 Tax=Streptomyces sp. NBC_01476 TaxID=2903881 RepID=UPI002E3724A8|nr:MarR family winged helix-turn-helix transcriptional regulator [Streptomyces sp. NBC_01476]